MWTQHWRNFLSCRLSPEQCLQRGYINWRKVGKLYNEDGAVVGEGGSYRRLKKQAREVRPQQVNFLFPILGSGFKSTRVGG